MWLATLISNTFCSGNAAVDIAMVASNRKPCFDTTVEAVQWYSCSYIASQQSVHGNKAATSAVQHEVWQGIISTTTDTSQHQQYSAAADSISNRSSTAAANTQQIVAAAVTVSDSILTVLDYCHNNEHPEATTAVGQYIPTVSDGAACVGDW
eukprot:7686-Heterococcus_DN1.PRE.2